jgi:hypothetical protein
MPTLKYRTIAASYGEILKLTSSGLSSTLSFVEDGNGVVSPLSLSTNAISILNTAVNGFYVGCPTTLAGSVTINAPLVCNNGLTVTGDLNLSVTPSFPRLTLTAATGIAPMVISSTTLVPNLNAQLHGGKLAPTGNIVGTSDIQTLTGKTISGSDNTFSNIPSSSVAGLPTGDVVGTTDLQTLSNKSISGSFNTFANIPNTAILGLGTLSTQAANSVSISGGSIEGSTIVGTIGGSTTINTTGNITGGAAAFTGLRVSGITGNTMIFPLADGNAGQVIATDGLGNLSFVSGGGGGSGGLSSVQADTSPRLGGNLDVTTFSIVSSSNRNITIAPNGTGLALISKVATPTTGTDAANKTYVDNSISAITADSVGKNIAQWNASKIRDISILNAAPADGQFLKYDAALQSYLPANAPGGVLTSFFGFKRSSFGSLTGAATHLVVDKGSGVDSFVKKDYIDTIVAAINNFTVNASGRLIANF